MFLQKVLYLSSQYKPNCFHPFSFYSLMSIFLLISDKSNKNYYKCIYYNKPNLSIKWISELKLFLLLYEGLGNQLSWAITGKVGSIALRLLDKIPVGLNFYHTLWHCAANEGKRRPGLDELGWYSAAWRRTWQRVKQM